MGSPVSIHEEMPSSHLPLKELKYIDERIGCNVIPAICRRIRSLSEAETANALRKTISIQRRMRSFTTSGADTIAINRRIKCVLFDNYFSLEPLSKARDIATTTTNGCYNRYFHSLSGDVARCAILIYYNMN